MTLGFKFVHVMTQGARALILYTYHPLIIEIQVYSNHNPGAINRAMPRDKSLTDL